MSFICSSVAPMKQKPEAMSSYTDQEISTASRDKGKRKH